jgi:FG-GAP repeat protein/CARDB protein
MKKTIISNLKLIAILLLISIGISSYALPTYDDVLVVINDDSDQSVEIGEYFVEQRNVPDINVCYITTDDKQASSDTSQMTPEAEAQAIDDIKNYLIDNNLEDKINYITLTRGIPYWAKHIESYGTRHLFDLQLLTSLADLKYYSGSIFKFNPFYYYIDDNYLNLLDYKFTKEKYGYYIVTRLDGPAVNGTKQQIDSSGYPAYHAYDKNNIKYLVIPPKLKTGSSSKIDELKLRTNIKLVYPDMFDNNSYDDESTNYPLSGGSGLLQRDVAKEISFAYFDWVGWESEFPNFYSNGEASSAYPSIYRGIEFLPGGVAEAFRSHPALYMNRHNGGAYEVDLVTNGYKKFKKFYTGEDLRFRHLTCVAYDPINNWVWCGTGDNKFDERQSYSDNRISAAAKQGYAKHRGGGIAVFEAGSGNVVSHFSPDSTAFYTPDSSDLNNARVGTVVYDKYDELMWIGHYEGVQYYDLQNNTWHSISGLTNDFAATYNIYVDPFDTDKVYFSFYYQSGTNSVVSSQIDGAANKIFEYSKSDKTVTPYHISDSAGVIPHIVKTSSDIMWVTWDKSLIKYKLSSKTVLQTIDLQDVVKDEKTIDENGYEYPALTPILNPRGLISTTDSSAKNIVCVAFTTRATRSDEKGKDFDPYSDPPNKTYIHQTAYVLRIKETGETASSNTLHHISDWEFSLNREQWIQSFVVDPNNSNKLYLAMGGHRGSKSVLSKSTDSGITWTKYSPLTFDYMLGMTVGENGKLYTAHAPYLSQQIIGDFILDGAVAVGGGMVHDSMYYDENDHSAFALPPYQYYGPYDANAGEVRTAQKQVEAMMFMILDGYSIADARFGVFKTYMQHGSGGHNSHMLVMPPKCAPFAPRIDEENTDFSVVGNNTIEIILDSPGLIDSMDGFMVSTINSNTLSLTDIDKVSLNMADYNIVYDPDTRKIIITGDFSGGLYYLTLKCGNDGIKNIKGAPMLNTREDEFKDEITYAIGNGVNPDDLKEYGNDEDDPDASVALPDMIVSQASLEPAVPISGESFKVKFTLKNQGNTIARAGSSKDQKANIYIGYKKAGSINYDNILSKAEFSSEFTVPASYSTEGEIKVRVVADAGHAIEEYKEANNFLDLFVTIAPPDLTPPAAPTNLSQVTNPEIINFEWDDCTDASGIESYEILLSGSSDFSTDIFSDIITVSNASSTKWVYGINYWKVRAKDSAENWSEWSSISEFSTSDKVNPSIPAGLKRIAENLTWDPTTDIGGGINHYVVEYADNIGFTDSATKTTTTNAIAISLLNLTKHYYYWRVKAVDHADNESAFSGAKLLVVTNSNEDDKPSKSNYTDFAYSVSISGKNMIFGADGKACFFRWNGLSYAKYELSVGDENLANPVSVSGETALVGSPYDDTKGIDSGSAYVYRWNGASYDQHKLTAIDGVKDDNFGSSVSIDGDVLAVGVCGDDDKGSNSGSVYVYRWYAAGDKYEQHKLTASDGTRHDNFGCSVFASGNDVIIGAYNGSGNTGSVYIYRWNGKNYKQLNKLTPSDGEAGDNFGISIANSENNIVVGASKDNDKGIDSGSAYVYRWNGLSYDEYKLTALDGAAGDNFGCSVAISGDNVIVGASNDDDNRSDSGSVYVFNWNGSTYSEVRKIIASDGSEDNNFGTSISVSGSKLLVGAKIDKGYLHTLEDIVHPDSPGTPTGLSVVIPAVGTSAILDWDDSANATQYGIQVDNNSNFSSPEFDELSSDSNITITGMDNDAIYYWRIKTYNDYVISVWSNGSSFLIAPIDNTLSTATLIDLSSDYSNHDYVGIKDAVDFYKFTLTKAGTFAFSLTDLASNASISLYSEYDYKSSKSYKKTKSASSKYNKTTGKTSAGFDNVLLNAGNYYVEIRSGDNGAGRYNTGYDLNINSNYFPAATEDEFNFKTGAGTPNPISLDDDADASASGWVGFGDAQDVFKFTVDKAGEFDFTLKDLSSKASFALYKEYEHKGSTKYKKVKNASSKYNKTTGKTTASFGNILMDTGDYYIEVLSGDKGKGSINTNYTLDIIGDYFPEATEYEFNFKTGAGSPNIITLDADADTSASDWVGFGDAQDVFMFTVDKAGKFDFTLKDLSSKASFALYKEYEHKGSTKYKKIKNAKSKYNKTTGKTTASFVNVLMDTGDYYIEVLSGDKGKGRYNTSYDLDVSGDYFPEATVDELNFKTGAGTPTDINLNEIASDWVGFGDAQDVYKLTLASGARLSFVLTELSSKAGLNVYVEYEDRGTKKYRKVKGTSSSYNKVTGKTSAFIGNLPLSAGIYHIEVISGDKGKGRYNTEYDLKVEPTS